jgi:hypothetical protein
VKGGSDGARLVPMKRIAVADGSTATAFVHPHLSRDG